MSRLRCLGWDHPRGFDCYVQSAKAYRRLPPDADIRWEARTLTEFGYSTYSRPGARPLLKAATSASRPAAPSPMTGKHDQWMIWLFLAPSLLAMAVFLYWPMVGTLWESFHDTSFISPEPRFVGLAVYQKVMADRDFGLLIANSIV